MIKYMHYTELETGQSNEIYFLTFWCYYDLHEYTARMSNDPQLIKKEKSKTPVTISPAKASLNKINRKMKTKYKNWLSVQNMRKHCLKILEVNPKEMKRTTCFENNKKQKQKVGSKNRVKRDNVKYKKKYQ